MRHHLVRLLRYRELLWLLARSELKARHRQTLLGMLWALVQPVSMMLVFLAVFSVFVRVPVEGVPYAVFAYLGLWSWLFFSNSIATGMPSVVGNMNLVTKASFPREVIPLSKILVVGFDFLVSSTVLWALLIAYGIPIASAWLAVPGIVMIQLMFTAGLVLLGSALYVLRRDVAALLPLGLQIWMFLSPVVYPVTVIPEQYRTLYMLNPMAMILEAYRSAMFLGTFPAPGLVVPAATVACLVLIAGYAYFKAVELRFADVM